MEIKTSRFRNCAKSAVVRGFQFPVFSFPQKREILIFDVPQMELLFWESMGYPLGINGNSATMTTKETIFGSKRIVVFVLLISVLVVSAKLYFHWTLARNGYRSSGPLNNEEKSMIGLATVAIILNAIALLGGTELVHRMEDKSFARRFNLAFVPFLVAALYFLLPWPWWLIAVVVVIPLALAIEERRLAGGASARIKSDIGN
jgi:hypothetical protein